MACQALGRCRICARKHKIAVFGGEEAQHFFIEKANLKLIILNTVCVGCIGKIERFVKKMDLGMVFNDYIKEEETRHAKGADNLLKKTIKSESEERIITQESNQKADDSSIAMEVDRPVEPNENSRKTNTSISTDVEKQSKAHARSRNSGDSPSAVSHLHRCAGNKIGQGTIVRIEPANEPRRKRPRNVLRTPVAGEKPGLNSSPAVPSSSPSIASADCSGPSDCSTTVKKGGRFLWCDFCKKEFTHAGDLNKHRRKHTGEKPYECNECKRKFAHASNLARHQRVHSGERPFSCTRCDRTFTRRDKLAIHTAAGKCQINSTASKDASRSATTIDKIRT